MLHALQSFCSLAVNVQEGFERSASAADKCAQLNVSLSALATTVLSPLQHEQELLFELLPQNSPFLSATRRTICFPCRS